MDEGRLGMVVRQEERHRKFVYMRNDIVRSRLGLYHNYLSKELHDNNIKLMKDCVEARRSIVRQKVLRKCLEMRRRKVTTKEGPCPPYGQYGGQPLWTLNRDIEKTIADNHPKLRRLKRVQEVMRQSLESGAILDDDAISRRMEAFFQLKHNRNAEKKSSTDRTPPTRSVGDQQRYQQPPLTEQSQDSLREYRLRRFGVASMLPPLTSSESLITGCDGESAASPRKTSEHRPPKRVEEETLGITEAAALKADTKGKLRGLKIKLIATIEELQEDEKILRVVDDAGETENTNIVQRTGENSRMNIDKRPKASDFVSVRSEGKFSMKSKLESNQISEHATSKDSGNSDSKPETGQRENKEQSKERDDYLRSKLILPPIKTTKALVTRK